MRNGYNTWSMPTVSHPHFTGAGRAFPPTESTGLRGDPRTQQVGAAHDADEAAIRQDRYAAQPPVDEELLDLGELHVLGHADHARAHDFGGCTARAANEVDSLTMPSTCPASSTTGAVGTRRSCNNPATSRTGMLTGTATTSRVMISRI